MVEVNDGAHVRMTGEKAAILGQDLCAALEIAGQRARPRQRFGIAAGVIEPTDRTLTNQLPSHSTQLTSLHTARENGRVRHITIIIGRRDADRIAPVRLFTRICLFVLSTCACRPGLAAATYRFETLEPPGARAVRARDINNEGHILGSLVLGDETHAFVFDGTTYTVIDFPDDHVGLPLGTNDHGEMVGRFPFPTDIPGIVTMHGFYFDGEAYSVVLFPDADRTVAEGINNLGQIVGGYGGTDWTQGHAFLLDDGVYSSFEFPDAQATSAADINDRGTVVGTYHNGYFLRTHSFLLDANGFTTLDIPGIEATAVQAINNTGHVAGTYVSSLFEGGHRGFVYDGTTYSLIDFPGAKETYVEGMNDLGQIVGLYVDPSYTVYSFLATPVPEPSTVVLGALALLAVFCQGARSHNVEPSSVVSETSPAA